MIAATAKLSIRVIPLDCIQVKEYQQRFPEKLTLYMHLLNEHPTEYAGLCCVVPSLTHAGMFALLDGHHKFCASIMTGRKDVLCAVIEDGGNV